MAEEITLTTPLVKPQQTTSSFHVARLLLDPELGRFMLAIRGTNGEVREAVREGAPAVALMSTLNTANGSVKSLQKRALEWFLTQPEAAGLAGTITGTPD